MSYDPIKVTSNSIGSLDSLCAALSIERSDLEVALALATSRRYRKKKLPKSDGSTRLVFDPHPLIRRIQRRVNRRIFASKDIIRWPDHLFGSIPNQIGPNDAVDGRDYVRCALKHCGAKSILTVDIRNFFDNIHRSLVEGVFRDFLKMPEEVSSALADICCRDDRLVQGALTSSYIACLCLYDVEGSIVRRLSEKRLTYTRLVDDINVSSRITNFDFGYAQGLIQEMLRTKGLFLNEDKTRVQSVSTAALSVHGLRVNFPTPRLPSDEVSRIRAAVQNIEAMAMEAGHRTSRAYRKDYNRCLGRVNKLARVGHNQHRILLKRLRSVYPLPSKRDITRAERFVGNLERDCLQMRDLYSYKRRFHQASERITILARTYDRTARSLRARLALVKPNYVH